MSKFKADLRIDPFNLNNEILEQPQKYYEWSYATAEAENDRDDAKDELDIIKSEIDARIRKKFKDDNLKEGEIKSKVDNHNGVKRARDKYMSARRKYNLLKRTEEAFRQRKSMLQTFVYRETNNMNSSIKTPQPFQKEMHDEFSNKIASDLSESMSYRRPKIKRR